MSTYAFRIDGTVHFSNILHTLGQLVRTHVDEGHEYVLAPSNEVAGEEARARWADMAENSPREIRAIVGDETLVQWALGQWGGSGSRQFRSLTEWLDSWREAPAEEFASYDGHERRIEGPTRAEISTVEVLRAVYRRLADEGIEAITWDGAKGTAAIRLGESLYYVTAPGLGFASAPCCLSLNPEDAFAFEPSTGLDESDLEIHLTNVHCTITEGITEDATYLLVEGWEALVEALGYTPTVAYRSN